MFQEIFSSLSNALETAGLVALLASLAWGILSVLLSPCHLASIPLVVGFVTLQDETGTRRAFSVSLLFALGILVSILIIGLVTGLLGRMLGDMGTTGVIGNLLVAAVLVLAGLYMLDVIKLSFLERSDRPAVKARSFWAPLGMGLLFGLSIGPCTFAYMAPMLAITFRTATTRLPYAILLLLVFAIGHSAVIVLAGTFSGTVERWLKWNSASKGLSIVKKVCGLLLIAAAIYLVLQYA